MSVTILRLAQVKARTGLSRTTIYELIKAGEFPGPIGISARSVGWVESEIDSWLSGKVLQSRTGDLPQASKPESSE